MAYDLQENFIKINVTGKATVEDCDVFLTHLDTHMQELEARFNDIFDHGPRIHGRFQQSQLDVIDIQRQKAHGMRKMVSAFRSLIPT